MKLHNAVIATPAAVVVMALLACSGCRAADDAGEPVAGSVTSSARPTSLAPGVDPYTLPPEQRPALFDPCTEIPESALREAEFAPEDLDQSFTKENGEELKACAWNTPDVLFSVGSYWTEPTELITSSKLVERSRQIVAGRDTQLLGPVSDTLKSSCEILYRTQRGTVNIALDSNGVFNEYRGERVSDSCETLKALASPIVPGIPEEVS